MAVGVYTDLELKERSLYCVSNILDSADKLYNTANRHGENWATWRGVIYGLLNSIEKLNSFFAGIVEPEKRLVGLPFNYQTVMKQNGFLISALEKLASRNLNSRLTELPNDAINEGLRIHSLIYTFYDTAQPALERSLDREFRTPLSEISKLTAEYSDYVDGNWAISVSYIALMDGFINRMRYRFKESGKDKNKDNNLTFQQRYAELQEMFHLKGIEILPGIIGKANALWSLRTNILHYADKPTREETKMIIAWVKDVINAFGKAEEDYKKQPKGGIGRE